MKFIAIRLIENMDPVMVLSGKISEWDEKEMFWKIDECVDPFSCEYMEVEIQKKLFGIMWPDSADFKDDALGGCELMEDFYSRLSETFELGKGWKPFNFDRSVVYASK